MSLRCEEPGWTKIGISCSSGRRSLWVRITPRPEALICRDDPDPEMRGAFHSIPPNVVSVELCSGREGDDGYVKILPDNPAFAGLLEVMNDAVYATEI